MTLEASPFRETNAAVEQHPAKALFDRAVEAVLPAVRTFALAKNVPLDEHDIEPVAIHAVKSVSRRTMRGIMNLDQKAILLIQASISHSLDILYLAKYIARVFADQGYPQPDMDGPCAFAQHLLRDNHANDRTPTAHKWPDLETAVRDHLINADAWDASAKTLTLPEDALRRCVIRLPVSIALTGSAR